MAACLSCSAASARSSTSGFELGAQVPVVLWQKDGDPSQLDLSSLKAHGHGGRYKVKWSGSPETESLSASPDVTRFVVEPQPSNEPTVGIAISKRATRSHQGNEHHGPDEHG